MNKLLRIGIMVKNLGVSGTIRYLFLERLLRLKGATSGALKGGATYQLTARAARHPLWCRFNTSDRIVFSQVFVDSQYSEIPLGRQVKLIVDCGANVGYTSVYFLSKYPSAHVVAVEPESGNFEQVERNLLSYGDRVKLLQAGVWPVTSDLTVSEIPYRDGMQWAFQVHECEQGDPGSIKGMSIASILATTPFSRIDILKVDIEGAEKELFSRNLEEWIDLVDQFQIELHDDDCRRIFFEALKGKDFSFVESRELVIATRSGLT